jgi:UDP-N-acetylmuramoylalanine--D-glutamate ligase
VKSAGVRGTRFSIIGGARSGLAVAKLLKAHGASVFLSDTSPAEKMEQTLHTLEALHVPYEFGANSNRVLDAEVMVLSPGVPSDAPVVRQAQAKGLRVVSEVEVASWFCPCPIVAITGTNGKTTTTTLLGRMFEDARKPSVVAGNIGVAFSEVVDRLDERHTAILEVSSFQLDHIESFKPTVSVMLNITPDHLDRYDHSFEKYIASKCCVFANQEESTSVVYNWDDEVARRNVEAHAPRGVRLLPFSTKSSMNNGAFVNNGTVVTKIDGLLSDIIATDDISIRGTHNLYNAMAATLAAKCFGVSSASLRATLKNFKGVEHRLEFVRELDGVTYVNDSKATNVDSVWYALQSFTSPIVVLVGGRDKGNDYTRLHTVVKDHVRAIVAIGESADTVVRAFAGVVHVQKAGTMDEAVATARALAHSGDVVLLSPACASFDWFENYEHRGRVFKQIVMSLN